MKPAENEAPTYRMRDLCKASGLERQAIHFYIQRGLLSPGQKTGRNTALYGEEHLERLRLIRQLKEERFLPLKAIKAILDGRDTDFSPEQRVFLGEVKERLRAEETEAPEAHALVPMKRVLEETGLDRLDVEEAISVGVVSASEDRTSIAQRDVWFLELFNELRRLGFTKERGFSVADVAVYERAISRLFRDELSLLTERLAGEEPQEVASMIRGALPVVHTFLARHHADLVREFFKTD